ncbi:unnamed protein product [Cylicocyclus nassatus]|uniref:Pecanex-like protein n=1 Tax=Cylicocyclus nassatus TaxID=53992 RepID=A0AA36DK78_CYLNA|nr:unnamed protein product [Cylicocyclus nassatus]
MELQLKATEDKKHFKHRRNPERKHSAWSCAFDVPLACTVSFLGGVVLATGIYSDIWLFLLAFTVAGAHFFLLKSVQPGASSPIHGFNWLVAYSRPVYFCILAVVLVLHHFCDDPNYDKTPWNWNPYRLYETSGEIVLLAVRDLFATFLLPFAFTMGWLSQVNTLMHHVLEQLEMHIFGGTASLGIVFVQSSTVNNLASSRMSVVGTPTNSYSTSRLCCAASSEQEEDGRVKDLDELDVSDPLPGRLKNAVVLRARHDMLFSGFLFSLALPFTLTRFDWKNGLPFGPSNEISPATVFALLLYLLIVLYPKWLELYLKMSFVMAYVAPWQISWGSAFHAFAQPFSIPHPALWTSYLVYLLIHGFAASQIHEGPMLDDTNLSAVFFKHLTRRLQKSLAGDLQMGRWATSVQPGDCFILASFYLNCLVHIIA